MSSEIMAEDGSARVRYKNADVPRIDDETQTELHVAPHFLTGGRLPNVLKESSVQTAISAAPNAQISVLLPELQKLSPQLLNSNSIQQLTAGKILSWREGGIVEPDPREIKHPVSSDMLSKSALKYPSIIDIVKPCISTVIELAINIAANYSDAGVGSLVEETSSEKEPSEEDENQVIVNSSAVEVQTSVVVRPFYVPSTERASVSREFDTQTHITLSPSLNPSKVYPALRSNGLKISSHDFIVDIPRKRFNVKGDNEYSTSAQTYIKGMPVAKFDFELIIKMDSSTKQNRTLTEVQLATANASLQTYVGCNPGDVSENFVCAVLNNTINEILKNSGNVVSAPSLDECTGAEVCETFDAYHLPLNAGPPSNSFDIHESLNDLNTLIAGLIINLDVCAKCNLANARSTESEQYFTDILQSESMDKMCRYIDQELENLDGILKPVAKVDQQERCPVETLLSMVDVISFLTNSANDPTSEKYVCFERKAKVEMSVAQRMYRSPQGNTSSSCSC